MVCNGNIKILYVSGLCSKNVFNQIYSWCHVKPRVASQNYHSLLVEGLAREENGTDITVLSSIPVTYDVCKRRILFFVKEKKSNIIYDHIPCLNFALIKELVLLIYVFFKTISWAVRYRKCKKVIICDVLNFSISFSARLVSMIFRLKFIAIVTDIPSLMLDNTKKTLRRSIYNSFSEKLIYSFDFYIFLTEQMSEILRTNSKKYIVVEGMVDSTLAKDENHLENKWKKKSVVYAGGIYREYGINVLVEAFQGIPGDSYRLIFYGDGAMVPELIDLCKMDKRIEYRGVVTHSEVLKAQLSASLLVNPRMSDLKLSAYSFPSKNLEYMASGTPVLTTMLEGIPKEYFDFVYYIKDESVEGIRKSLLNLLEKSNEELHSFGRDAQNYVLSQKNNERQAKRILEFISKF
jgi:glycosyltransferase involved in cell wall biosynthesis